MEDNKDNLVTSEEMPGEVTQCVSEDAEVGEVCDITEVTAEETSENIVEAEITDNSPVEENTEENTEVAVITTAEQETKEPEKKAKKGTGKKILKGIGIFLFVAFLAFSGFVGYKVWDYLQVYVYTTQHTAPVTFENETISLTVDNIEIIDEIIGFEMDGNYVYVGVKYTTTNKSDAPLEWKNFPLLMVKEYVRDEEDTGFVLVENTDQPFEMTGLRNYAIHQELDLRTAKDNLEVGQSRQTADIFKILRTDYEAKKYFLTSDLFNEIVTLPELPAEVVTDDVTDTMTDTAE